MIEYRYQFHAMGSPCEFYAFTSTHNTFKKVVRCVVDEICRLEEKYTRYKPTGITAEINASSGSGKPVLVDDETWYLLNFADVMYQQSDGLFDMTAGVLRRAWDFRQNTLPKSNVIQDVLPLVGWPSVALENKAIMLPDQGMEIDFGGFVKEYAADKAAQVCRGLGVTSALINLGGDIFVVGPKPDGVGWHVGIRHPRKPEKAMFTLRINRGGIASSGDYERYLVNDGQRYCHILNPKTGWSIQPTMSCVTVLADQCLVAGGLSTIAMLKSDQASQSHALDWLCQAGAEYLAIDQSMEVKGSLSPDNRCYEAKGSKLVSE